MMTGSGGWPLSVFLTPEQKPFYGGTYFPPIAALAPLKLGRVFIEDRFSTRGVQVMRGSRGK